MMAIIKGNDDDYDNCGTLRLLAQQQNTIGISSFRYQVVGQQGGDMEDNRVVDEDDDQDDQDDSSLMGRHG